MEKNRIGVYRTVYPLYSETFISEQIKAYTEYEPVVVCRELIRSAGSFCVVTLSLRWRNLKKFGFTVFGVTSVFDNHVVLQDLKLIHAHFAADSVLALSLTRKLQIPLVVTCHGSDVLVSDRFLLKSAKLTNWRYLVSRKKLMQKASVFIAVSDFLRNAMIKNGYPAEKIIKHYIGVNTATFTPRKNAITSKGGSNFILSVARHAEVKGIDVLLKAFARVVRQHPQLRLVQIGGGELMLNLKALAAELGVENNIDFLGPQPPAEVLNYLQACKALILSSRQAPSGAEEAFGLVLIEAAACGVPCVGTNVGGIPEAIVHGETGFIVESENDDELAEKISVLVNDPELAASMGKRGREMVCELFDIGSQTKKLEALYTRLLG